MTSSTNSWGWQARSRGSSTSIVLPPVFVKRPMKLVPAGALAGGPLMLPFLLLVIVIILVLVIVLESGTRATVPLF